MFLHYTFVVCVLCGKGSYNCPIVLWFQVYGWWRSWWTSWTHAVNSSGNPHMTVDRDLCNIFRWRCEILTCWCCTQGWVVWIWHTLWTLWNIGALLLTKSNATLSWDGNFYCLPHTPKFWTLCKTLCQSVFLLLNEKIVDTLSRFGYDTILSLISFIQSMECNFIFPHLFDPLIMYVFQMFAQIWCIPCKSKCVH